MFSFQRSHQSSWNDGNQHKFCHNSTCPNQTFTSQRISLCSLWQKTTLTTLRKCWQPHSWRFGTARTRNSIYQWVTAISILSPLKLSSRPWGKTFNRLKRCVLIRVFSAALLDIFVSMLTIQLSEEAYPALLAELSYNITVKDRGILLKFEGYNEKLPVRCSFCHSRTFNGFYFLGVNWVGDWIF